MATYKVHRVRTTVDATGLHLREAIEQGAEVFIPEDVEPREVYRTPQFEREITLPDRTREMVRHLAGLLRRFGPTEKTMVFCVDMEHARLVARLLQDEFSDLGYDNYAVPIISEEGEEENIRNVTERHDVILTNPPFGGVEGRHIQQNFPIKSQATELLFLQHIMKKLKARDGARCGMVVPEGTLFRGGPFADVKRELLEQFNLHTVVSLPPGTFAPYSDVKTALIFFERPSPTEEIWYYELPLPPGLKKFSKGSPIRDEHFEEAKRLWREWDAYRKGRGPRPEPTERSWIVSAEEIKSRGYDLTARNPNRPESEALPSPAEIVAGLLEKERQILSIVEELSELLGNNREGLDG